MGRLLLMYAIVIVSVEIAFEADDQAAFFRIKTAQGGGGLHMETGVGELLQDARLQSFHGLIREAVGHTQNSAVPEATLPDHFHQSFGGLLGTTGLVRG